VLERWLAALERGEAIDADLHAVYRAALDELLRVAGRDIRA
jgi:hypothetical protein